MSWRKISHNTNIETKFTYRAIIFCANVLLFVCFSRLHFSEDSFEYLSINISRSLPPDVKNYGKVCLFF